MLSQYICPYDYVFFRDDFLVICKKYMDGGRI